MSASTLLAWEPPRQISSAFSSGGGGGGGVTSVNGDTGAITIAAGTGITVTAPTAGTVEIAGTLTAPVVAVDNFGASPAPISLTGVLSSDAWGAGYSPITMTAGKTYTVTGTIQVEVVSVTTPGGFWEVDIQRSVGAPVSSAIMLSEPVTAVAGEKTLTFSCVVPAGAYTQLDVLVQNRTVDSATEVTYTLKAFSAVEWP